MKRCDSLPHSMTIACFSWLIVVNVDVDRPSAEGHPKQRNRPYSSPGCLGATCQAHWTWRSHAAGTACSSSSREPRLTANITVNMFSVAVYYLTSVQDASTTPGPCSRTAHRHTLLGTHLTLFWVPFSRRLECVVQQQCIVDTLSIWCKNCMMWVTLDNNWDNKHVVSLS